MSRKVFAAGLLVLLAVPVATRAQEYVQGVVSTGSHRVAIDEVYFVVDSNYIFTTAGWGGDSMTLDTFDFPVVPDWPREIGIIGTYDDTMPLEWLAQSPVKDSWYVIGEPEPVEPMVKFGPPAAVGEMPAGSRVVLLLAVEPSLVTSEALIRAEPGPGSVAALEILDAAGNRVRVLDASGSRRLSFAWRGTDDAGRRLADGVYFCRLVTSESATVRKLILAR